MLTTSYARVEIVATVVVGAAATAVVGYFLHWWAFVPGVLTLALLSFYRHPRRRPPVGDDIIVAPADGKVVEIARQAEGPEGCGPVARIMIFLRIYDVHVNRSPCAGHVSAVAYRPGEFLNAMRADAGVRNECNVVTIAAWAPLPSPVTVRQIAGVLARRIVCTAAVGDEVAVGQPFGMIKLGSRTEVVLPEHPDWQIAVAVGDKVHAGRTIMARLRRGE